MKFFWAILKEAYLHFFAVVGALSLASLVATVDLFDWPSSILHMIAWWKSIAYPIVDAVFNPILSWISSFVEFEIRLSNAMKDYLGVGIALTFSRFRGALFGWKKPAVTGEARPTADRAKVLTSLLRKPILALQLLLRTVFVWPIEVVLMTRLVFFARSIFPESTEDYVRNVRISNAIPLLPIFYCIALVLVSWMISIYHFVRKR